MTFDERQICPVLDLELYFSLLSCLISRHNKDISKLIKPLSLINILLNVCSIIQFKLLFQWIDIRLQNSRQSFAQHRYGIWSYIDIYVGGKWCGSQMVQYSWVDFTRWHTNYAYRHNYVYCRHISLPDSDVVYLFCISWRIRHTIEVVLPIH